MQKAKRTKGPLIPSQSFKLLLSLVSDNCSGLLHLMQRALGLTCS